MSVIIYITKRNQKLKLACKRTKVSLRRKTVQTAVGSDIGLPYNASGGRMTTSGWEFACLWVLGLARRHTAATVLSTAASSWVSPSSTAFYRLVLKSQIDFNLKSHNFTPIDTKFAHFNLISSLFKSSFRGLRDVSFFRTVHTHSTMLEVSWVHEWTTRESGFHSGRETFLYQCPGQPSGPSIPWRKGTGNSFPQR